MELYIGGCAQGKLSYVLGQSGCGRKDVFDGAGKQVDFTKADKKIFNHFHEWFRRKMEQGENPEEIMEGILAQNPLLIIISNETGNGIVPLNRMERAYRERLGRYLCRLAGEAKRVERIMCGIGQRIK